MREMMTTLLDALGLLLIAAGTAGGLWAVAGPVSLAPAGVVILGGSALAARAGRKT